MLLFGHVGITAAAAKIGDSVFPESSVYQYKSGFRYSVSSLLNRIRDIGGKLDYRMVIIGSMLPDIIDKPVFLFLRDRGFEVSGRGYAHTLLFSFVLIIGGLFVARKKKPWLITLGLASAAHLLLDQIWEMPVTLFWPFLGPITAGDTEGWFTSIWENLISEPWVYVPEIIGLLFTLYLAYRIIRGRGIIRFIINGNIG
jgi:inner membrane protein